MIEDSASVGRIVNTIKTCSVMLSLSYSQKCGTLRWEFIGMTAYTDPVHHLGRQCLMRLYNQVQ